MAIVYFSALRKRKRMNTVQAQAFDPVVTANMAVLILGTVPGAESIRQGQYYANSRNLFWTILCQVLGVDDPIEYEKRLGLLKQNRIALWDVLHSCRRSGSSDSRIKIGTERPNDIGAFLTTHPTVRGILFNGKEAERQFHRHIAPGLPKTKTIQVKGLPSSNPANTRSSKQQKVAKWRIIRDILGE